MIKAASLDKLIQKITAPEDDALGKILKSSNTKMLICCPSFCSLTEVSQHQKSYYKN
jgi:hypothetical protein